MKHTWIERIGVCAVGLLSALALLCGPGGIGSARADEGMWTLDNLPLKQLQEHYGFAPTPEWIEHVQKASVNFGGASGAFVSSDGLVLTNHHVALGQLQKVSSPKNDYVHDGFFARSRQEEMRCPDMDLRVLMSMQDVTDSVLKAIDPAAASPLQNVQRRAAIARIEKASHEATGLRSQVVELYHGGQYWLYRYKTYKDVRLVMAPEEQAAFYGGDPDNFGYPRHDLDYAFFRVYEDGRPVAPASYLRWSSSGPVEGDLVFVCGHPGSTERTKTVAQLKYQQQTGIPLQIELREKSLAAYREYAKRGPEQARQTRGSVRGLENTLKRMYGFREALARPELLRDKQTAESDLRARAARDPALARQCGASWERIEDAEREMTRRSREYLCRTTLLNVRPLENATTIVRYVTEVPKPNQERLEEFRDTRLDLLRYQLFSPAPQYPEMSEAMLAFGFATCVQELGAGDPFVKAALGGRSPEQLAHELISGTHLMDVAERKRLIEGGTKAVEESTDPLLVWARRMDGMGRELRKWHQDNVESVESLEGGKIARARFALDGKSVYPDATGTLRLSYGKVAGYEQLTTRVPWKTTFFGLYDRAQSFDNRYPFSLPQRVLDHRKDVELTVPLNFVITDDIVGGNSGSPVIDRNGNYVGLIFDGNVQAFAWDYAYSDFQARAVAVHPAAIVESLRKIYGMNGLAEELLGGGAQSRP